MRKNKSIRLRKMRSKKEPMEVDITSLLDILVILLVFLLKSYNSSGIVFNINKDVKLPFSESQSINTTGIIVQVSQTKISVEDKVVYDEENPPPRAFDQGNRRIIPLFEELSAKREEIKLIQNNVPNAKKFSGVINFVIDKRVRYNYVKKLMYTAAEAGYVKFNFVVLGEAE